MDSLYLQQAKDDLKGHLLLCEETGTELERSPYAITTALTFRGLPCIGKEIFPSLCQQDPRKFARRLSKECTELSQLAHPNIVQFMGVYFTPRNNALIVMEHLPVTLGATLDLNPSLPDPLTYGILTDVILGFRYLHERAEVVVHRDFNANNVLLTSYFRAKISDLGIAKIADTSISKASRLSKVPGTLCYVAPEVLVNSPKFDTTSNIFSYGILVLHLFSGQWPLPTEATILDPKLHDKLIPVSEWDRRQEFVSAVGSTHPLASLTKTCLSNNPTLRPKAYDIWQIVTHAKANKQKTEKERLELIIKLNSPSSSTPPGSKPVAKKAEFEPRVSYENHQPIGGQSGKQPLMNTKSLERGRNLPSFLEKAKSSSEAAEKKDSESAADYENQLLIGGLFNKPRSPLDSGPFERKKDAPSVPERGSSSPGFFEKKGTSSPSSTDRARQPPPVAGKTSKPSPSSSSTSASISSEIQFPSVLEKSKFLFDQKNKDTRNLPGNNSEKEARDSQIGRLSSRFSKTLFEEPVEEKAEMEQRRQRVNSNSSDAFSKLTKMFTTIQEPQASPILPKTAPKPTHTGRWRSQQQVETQLRAPVAVTTNTRRVEHEDSVDEVYDSYVDMTPKILEEESKVRIFAKVVYDYVAEDDDELTISVGETVEVVDIQEHDDQPQWWLVRKGEAFGNIPSTYVTIIQNPQTTPAKTAAQKPSMTSTNPAHRGSRQSGSDHFTQQQSAPSFLRNRSPTRGGDVVNRRTVGALGGGGGGRGSHRASIFVNLDDFKSRRKTVEALFGPQTSIVTTPTPQVTPTPQPAAPRAVPQPKSYVALYDFTPNSKDEIGFIAGDHVVDAYDLCEGWLQGTIVRTGQRGNVPKTYFRT